MFAAIARWIRDRIDDLIESHDMSVWSKEMLAMEALREMREKRDALKINDTILERWHETYRNGEPMTIEITEAEAWRVAELMAWKDLGSTLLDKMELIRNGKTYFRRCPIVIKGEKNECHG